MLDYFEARERVRRDYLAAPSVAAAPPKEMARAATAAPLGNGGFLTEIAGRTILTAPASTFSLAEELPTEIASGWAEKAGAGNQHYTWLQARYVEAERANRNGAMWSTADLQFGAPSVANGPLNWLHNEKAVVGTIADNALIMPAEDRDAAGLLDPRSRPYMATVAAMWNWVHPERAKAVHYFANEGKVWTSMECIGSNIQCASDDTHTGCGQTFDYVKSMTEPESTCEHLQNRSGARRIVNPTFLGGAVLVPPAQPGWADANVEMLRNAAAWVEDLAAKAHSAAVAVSDSEWVSLVATVAAYSVRA